MVPRPLESLEMNETVEFNKNIKHRDKCFVVDANLKDLKSKNNKYFIKKREVKK